MNEKRYLIEHKFVGPGWDGTPEAEWHMFDQYDTYNMASYIANEVIYETTEYVRITDRETSTIVFENKA